FAKVMQKLRLYWVLLALGVFFLLGSLLLNGFYTYSLSGIADRAGQTISEKAGRSEKALQRLMDSHSDIRHEALFRLFDRQKIGIYLFYRDSLVFWNNAQIPLETGITFFPDPQGFAKLAHGYYFYKKLSRRDTAALALCLVKPLYTLQNNYLKN